VVTDISSDPLWDDFRELALGHDLLACWSTPIWGSDGHVLGTFALYHHEPKAPSPRERELVAVLTYLASIAIERRRHEEERSSLLERERAARAEAETMLGQIVDAVIVIDATGRTTYLNESAKRLLGVDTVGVPPERRSEDYGMLTAEGAAFRAEDLPSMRAMREKQVITGVDMLVRRPDGTEIPVQENAAPIIAEHGTVVGAIATLRDMSAQHKLERQKEDFLAAAAHDLKNPIAVLQGQAQLLRRRAQRGLLDQEQVMAGVEVIESRARAMTKMIDELMDVTRLRMGEPLQLNRQQADLANLVRDMVDVQRAASDGHHLVFQAAEGAYTGSFDTSRLARVLANLLSNAVKFSPEGSEIKVRLQREERDGRDWAAVAVRDHGLGIPAQDLQHVFEWFYRAENVAGTVSGTGIGLAGARQIVEQHGGTIDVKSRVGAGSTFTIRLPMEPAGEPASEIRRH
jgi:two-component system phosphate regulon sensor histidine kinase PhoR